MTEPIDLGLLARLAAVVDEATAAMEAYNYTRALEVSEAFFWSFCDDYVELVKSRAYGDDAAARSAQAALALALSVQLRLFAPVLPFVTEEVWSWWQEGSVHRAPWPDVHELATSAEVDPQVLSVASDVIGSIRRAKSEQKLSIRTEVESMSVQAGPEALEALRAALSDVQAAGRVRDVELVPSEDGELVTTVGGPAATV